MQCAMRDAHIAMFLKVAETCIEIQAQSKAKNALQAQTCSLSSRSSDSPKPESGCEKWRF